MINSVGASMPRPLTRPPPPDWEDEDEDEDKDDELKERGISETIEITLATEAQVQNKK